MIRRAHSGVTRYGPMQLTPSRRAWLPIWPEVEAPELWWAKTNPGAVSNPDRLSDARQAAHRPEVVTCDRSALFRGSVDRTETWLRGGLNPGVGRLLNKAGADPHGGWQSSACIAGNKPRLVITTTHAITL